jgi:4-amino-4-deoxy-L-arabinose transferase-like glycosyltransferase
LLVSGQGVLPSVVVVPMAGLAVLVVTAHLVAMHSADDVPVSRRRIRTVAGIVMLFTSVLLAYAFSYVRPDDPARFTTVWTAAIMLLTAVLALGGLDAVNNVRLARLQRRRVRRSAGCLHEQLTQALTDAVCESVSDDDPAPSSLRGGPDEG